MKNELETQTLPCAHPFPPAPFLLLINRDFTLPVAGVFHSHIRLAKECMRIQRSS